MQQQYFTKILKGEGTWAQNGCTCQCRNSIAYNSNMPIMKPV
jgi:hypothetical protein